MLETISLNCKPVQSVNAMSVLLMSWYLTDWSEQAGYTAYLLLFSVFRAQRCFDCTTARLGIVFFIQTKYINI